MYLGQGVVCLLKRLGWNRVVCGCSMTKLDNGSDEMEGWFYQLSFLEGYCICCAMVVSCMEFTTISSE